MKHILVAIDGRRESRPAIAEGLKLAQRSGAAVTFANVQSPSTSQLDSIARGLAILGIALAAAEEVGVEATGELTEGDAATEIVRLARKQGADLIVVGSRSRPFLASLVLGSVSRAVTRKAEIEVLVATEPELDRSETEARDAELVSDSESNASRARAKAILPRFVPRRAKGRRRENLGAPSA